MFGFGTLSGNSSGKTFSAKMHSRFTASDGHLRFLRSCAPSSWPAFVNVTTVKTIKIRVDHQAVINIQTRHIAMGWGMDGIKMLVSKIEPFSQEMHLKIPFLNRGLKLSSS
jgi:hypothetical protein